MDKVLVTGGLGVIGAAVCRGLLNASLQPLIYDMGSDTVLISDIARECIIEHGNICDLPRLMEVAARHKPIGVAHLAGAVGPQADALPWAAINTNLMGTTTIFEMARFAGIPRVVITSSKNVYGPVGQKHWHPNYEPVTEDHPREPHRLYGKLKRICEEVGEHYAKLYGLDIIALRFSSSFGLGKVGRNERVNPIIGMIETAIANQPFRVEKGGEQRDDLCYTAESANGFVAALKSTPCPGTFRAYNISSGELLSLSELIAIVKELYPSWTGEAGPGVDYRGAGLGMYYRMSTQKAQREIGFKSTYDFRRAVMDYAELHARLKL